MANTRTDQAAAPPVTNGHVEEDEETITPLRQRALDRIATEPDKLKKLFGVMDQKTAVEVDAVIRRPIGPGGDWVEVFRFSIHPVEKPGYEKSAKTAIIGYKHVNGRREEQTDPDLYRQQLIYEASTEETRRDYWDNRAAWAEKNVRSGLDVIRLALHPGERVYLERLIDKISGFGAPDDPEDTDAETMAGN